METPSTSREVLAACRATRSRRRSVAAVLARAARLDARRAPGTRGGRPIVAGRACEPWLLQAMCGLTADEIGRTGRVPARLAILVDRRWPGPSASGTSSPDLPLEESLAAELGGLLAAPRRALEALSGTTARPTATRPASHTTRRPQATPHAVLRVRAGGRRSAAAHARRAPRGQRPSTAARAPLRRRSAAWCLAPGGLSAAPSACYLRRATRSRREQRLLRDASRMPARWSCIERPATGSARSAARPAHGVSYVLLRYTGRVDEAFAAAHAAVRQLEGTAPGRAPAMAYANMSHSTCPPRTSRADDRVGQPRALAEQLGEDEPLLYALGNMTQLAMLNREPGAAERVAEIFGRAHSAASTSTRAGRS